MNATSPGDPVDLAEPRFDLRFQAGRGRLVLRRPVQAFPARVEALVLAVDLPKRFDLGRGIERLRHMRARVEEALARVGLGGLGDRLPGTLSGGQQSRAALARILVQDRPLILLDEPFAALGPALKADMLDLVADLARAQGASVLMITHDPRDARRIADDAILVAEGRAAPPVPTAALLDKPPKPLQDYLAQSS